MTTPTASASAPTRLRPAGAARLRRAAAAVGLAALAVLAAGCASPARLAAGSTPDAAVASLGQPTARYPLPDGGQRLQYSEMPAGSHVWNADFDASGRLLGVDDGLRYLHFDQLVQGRSTSREVLFMLGQPMRIDRVYSFNGPIWAYRFKDLNNSRFAYIHIDPAGVVQKIVYEDEFIGRNDNTR